MSEADKNKPEAGDIAIALGLLSRLPLVPGAGLASDRGSRAAWAYPVVGVVVGALTACVAAVGLWLGLSAPLCAALAMLAGVMMTGAMHEDGLADSADGLWGGWTRERRLEIMKDSHIGTYGVLAIGFSLLLRWGALSAILAAGGSPWVLVAVGALSRAPMVVLMTALPNPRQNGLSSHVGRPPVFAVWGALGIGVLLTFVALGLPGFWVLIWVAALAALTAWTAQRKIGGQTGDILGACQQVSEITALLVISVIYGA